jgi:predicted Zn finger-like uncharacterized protein
MAAQVTQCPNCGTSFRITDAQLTLAKGSVRCGACLSVFKAADYFIQEAPPVLETVYAEDELTSDLPPIDELPYEDALVESPVEDPEFSFSDALGGMFGDEDNAPSAQNISERANVNQGLDDLISLDDDPLADLDNLVDDNDLLFDDSFGHDEVKNQRIEPSFDEDELNIEFDDDTQIDDNLDIGPDEPEASSLFQDDLELSDDFMSAHDDASPDNDMFIADNRYASEEIIGDSGLADESWATSMLEELETEPEPAATKMDRAEFTADDEQLHVATNDHFVLGGDDEYNDSTEVQIPANMLAGLKVAPVQFQQVVHSNKLAIIGWGFLSILLLAMIPLQYAYFEFKELSRQAEYRPLYEQACTYIGCTLPSMVAVDKIKTEHIVPPRSHPKYKDALIVDFIMNNRAKFAQPFPLVELSFTDINDKVIASRRFTPEEYLGGELTGTKIMPIQTPISLSLEIVDPGVSASGYNLHYLPLGQ